MNKLTITALITASILISFTASAQTLCVKDSTHFYNANNELVQRFIFKYNPNGLVSEQFLLVLSNNVWVNSNRDEFSYNASGEQTEQIRQEWVNNAWQNQTRYTRTFDANNNLIASLTESWDAVNSTWVFANFSFQQYYIYNSQNQKTQYIQVQWQNGVPVDSTRHTYTYDNNGNEISNFREGWTANDPTWKVLQEWTTTYNGNSLKDTVYNKTWNG